MPAYIVTLAVALVLAGCGWKPIYSSSSSLSTHRLLASIDILPIPERAGQILRENLEINLTPYGKNADKRYRLKVTLDEANSLAGLQGDATYTRTQLTATARFQLTDTQRNKVILRGRRIVHTNFDYLESPYAHMISAREHTKRLMKRLAEMLTIKIVAFLQHYHEKHS
ncbi:MAG: hypothetical protein GDA50_03615 [Alphaproteobacteria bacterium GM202ARS2]|nr:hypothetical protein [Alphaproteobacteria bacterium GM202ARS2]